MSPLSLRVCACPRLHLILFSCCFCCSFWKAANISSCFGLSKFEAKSKAFISFARKSQHFYGWPCWSHASQNMSMDLRESGRLFISDDCCFLRQSIMAWLSSGLLMIVGWCWRVCRVGYVVSAGLCWSMNSSIVVGSHHNSHLGLSCPHESRRFSTCMAGEKWESKPSR